MNVKDITTAAGANRLRKRIGRGRGSGHGKTSGRGHKGAGQRSGYRSFTLREGAMFPLFRRIPKVGFNNANFRTEYQIVNVEELEARYEEGGHVTAASLKEQGLIRSAAGTVKILGNGELKKKLSVEAQRFSAEAAKKIEGVGGSVTRLGPQPKKKFVKRPKVVEEEKKGEAKAGSKGGKKEKKPSKPPAKSGAAKTGGDGAKKQPKGGAGEKSKGTNAGEA